MNRTKLISGTDATDGTSYTTPAVTAPANNLVLVFVTSSNATLFVGPPGVPTVTFAGSVMGQVGTVAVQDRRLSCFQLATTQALSGAFKFDFQGQEDYCAWSAFSYDGLDAVPVAQSKSAASEAVTIALSIDLAGNASNICAAALITTGNVNVTPGNGLATIDQIDTTQGIRNGTFQTVDGQPLVQKPSWTWSSIASAAALAVELKVATATGGTGTGGTGTTAEHPWEKLIRRFEPILYLHEKENFLPVNARRFVESANLWTTNTPRYLRQNWGTGPADGFPRAATSMKVSTVAAEPDTFYIDSLDPTTSRGSFLELGGWNDKALAHEDGVTAATQNAYSDRDAIDGRYDHDLKESRFWYHAEVIDTARLQAVAAAQWAPDLSLVLAQIDRPALLCYYLFFPAHVQSIACTETSGIEVSSHAGDWQCVAILLDGDLNGDAALLNPRYFGLTGTRPTDFKAYGFDDDELTAMKAYEWKRPGPGVDELPHTVVGPNAGLHPQVYVSLGSHSLYVDAFDHAVDPYPDSVPHDCGNSDGVGILPPSPTVPDVDSIPDSEAWPNALKVWGAFLLKLITGATAGGKVGGLQGSVAGGAAGAVSGVAEIANSLDTSPFGYGGDPNVDKPKGDVGPPFRTGTTIKPAAVTAPGAGTTVVPWQVAQNAVIGGRAGHDYVVDRNLQKWWPDDTGEHGYLGRWGQRVADDTLPRRSGPRFPNYARMFLTALAHLGDT